MSETQALCIETQGWPKACKPHAPISHPFHMSILANTTHTTSYELKASQNMHRLSLITFYSQPSQVRSLFPLMLCAPPAPPPSSSSLLPSLLYLIFFLIDKEKTALRGCGGGDGMKCMDATFEVLDIWEELNTCNEVQKHVFSSNKGVILMAIRSFVQSVCDCWINHPWWFHLHVRIFQNITIESY